jgi:hypothetical protein
MEVLYTIHSVSFHEVSVLRTKIEHAELKEVSVLRTDMHQFASKCP